MIEFLLLITGMFVAAKLLFSQRAFWVQARRNVGRLLAGGAAVFVLLIALNGVASQRAPAPVGLTSQVEAASDEPAAVVERPDGSEPAAEAADDLSGAAPQKDDDQAMVLFVTSKELQKLIGKDSMNRLGGLEGLQRVYAMVPLSTKGPAGLPPVLREALSPAALRQVLSPAGIKVMTAALTQILTAGDDQSDGNGQNEKAAVQSITPVELLTEATAESPEGDDVVVETEEPRHILATWVDNPGVGQVVVKSDFLEATTREEEALRSPIEAALKLRVSHVVERDFGADASWDRLVDVSLSDGAIRDCIVSTDVRTEVIETSEGSHPMQQTFALVEFPESMELQVLSEVKSALRQNRLIAVCCCVAVLWLTAILLSVACRATQGGSLLHKLFAFPVMALLIVPCMLAFAFLIGAMIKGATFEFFDADGRISCVVNSGETRR